MHLLNPLTIGAAGLLALIAASLPDPGEPTVIPIAGVVGTFLGAAVARARRLDRTAMREYAEDGGFLGAAVGIALYAASLGAEL